MTLIPASKINETTSTEESKPVSSKLVTRKNDDGKDFTAYNLSLSIHCTKCKGEGEPNPKLTGCVSIYRAEEKPGYFSIDDFNTPKPRAVPRNIPWMHGLEDFFKAVPDGKTPRVELRGNFCQLAANEAKGLSEETVGMVFRNMDSAASDTNLWEFLFGLEEFAFSFEEPLVYFEEIDQAKYKDGQEEDVFRVEIVFT